MAGHPGAAPLGHGAMVDTSSAERVRAFVASVGLVKACQRLHVSDETLRAACSGGRLKPATVSRLLAAIEREQERAA